MLEGVDSTVSYTPVVGIRYLCIRIEIESSEGLIILSWTYQKNPKILFYLIPEKGFILVYHIYTCNGSK